MATAPSRIVFGAPALGDDEIAEVLDSLKQSWIGTGPKVAAFEDQFLAYKGANHGVAVSSCTAALHLSLLALDLPPGAEVITSAFTFCATINAIIHAGATPVLVDVDPSTQNLDLDQVEASITPRTGAILPVHFAGRPCEMDRLLSIAERHQVEVVEDCAHAIEASFRDHSCGTMGRFGCFSFYATKNLTTGEGGMILCRDKADAERLRSMALHGLSSSAWRRYSDAGYQHYEVSDLGFKYNLSDLHASIGIHQLKRLEEHAQRRLEIWNRYTETFSLLPITLPAPLPKRDRHALHLYTILIDPEQTGVSRDQFLADMDTRGIGTGVHYRAIPEHPYYRERFGWNPENWPIAQRIGNQTVSLPLSPALNETDVTRVIEAVHSCLSQ